MGEKDTLPVGDISLRPRDSQCLHNTFDSRNIFAAVIEDCSNDGLHGRSHWPRVDSASLRSILIHAFNEASREASLRKIGVGCLFGEYGVYLT